MKIKPIKTVSLIITIASLYIGFSNLSYAKESYNNRESIRVRHNSEAEKQSILFQAMYKGLLIDTFKSLVEVNNACDYCKLQKQVKKNCNRCKLLEKFPFKNLHEKLIVKLANLEKEEYNSLKKLDNQLAEDLDQLLNAFPILSGKQLNENRQLYEILYNLVEQKGYFPNILDHLTLWKCLANDLIAFFYTFEDGEIITPLAQATKFSELLIEYKKFLDNNTYTLSQIQQYLVSEYTMEDAIEVKSLDDIMARITHNEQQLEDESWEKDLL